MLQIELPLFATRQISLNEPQILERTTSILQLKPIARLDTHHNLGEAWFEHSILRMTCQLVKSHVWVTWLGLEPVEFEMHACSCCFHVAFKHPCQSHVFFSTNFEDSGCITNQRTCSFLLNRKWWNWIIWDARARDIRFGGEQSYSTFPIFNLSVRTWHPAKYHSAAGPIPMSSLR